MARRSPALLPFPVLRGKFRPPVSSHGVVARPRLSVRLHIGARVTLVVAPPGFGKTTVAQQYVEDAGAPTAWLSIDALDGSPGAFWPHFDRAVRSLLPDLDDRATAARAAGRDGFLRLLMADVERSAHDGVLVLDGVTGRLDRDAFEQLALFVERVGHRVRTVITARSDPALPLTTWRAAGWMLDLDETDLRFTDAEAQLVSGRFDGLGLSSRSVVALNHHVDGWPIAFHLALATAAGARDLEARAAALLAVDELLRDYVAAEVLDRLAPAHRSAALALSVPDRFDAELGHALAGPDAAAVVEELRDRHLAVSSIADPPGTTRLHPMIRRLLGSELCRRDPHRHAVLNRLVARLWAQRDDHNAAYRHLLRAGGSSVEDLVMSPALRLAHTDDRRGLAALVDSCPRAGEVEHPGLACDLAIAALFAGRAADAELFCERAGDVSVGFGDEIALRLHATRGLIALRRGDLDAAAAHVGAFEQLESRVHSQGPVERHFALAGARVALARRDLAQARRWLDRTRWIVEPDVVAHVTVPALEARFELLCGRLQVAEDRIELACGHADSKGLRPHAATVEAEITAARVRLAVGDLEAAASHAHAAIVESDLLGYDRDRVRAGLVAANVRLLTDGPAASLGGIRDLLLGIDHVEAEHLGRRIDLVTARAHLRANRPDAARVLLERVGDRPRARLARAEVALVTRRHAELAELLEGASEWLPAERIEAALLRAAAERSSTRNARIAAMLEEAAVAGWVSPFLGHCPPVEDVLLRQPIERLHPRLASVLRRVPRPSAASTARVAPHANAAGLTARELTILELLPSHRSYAQIAAELYLSHNTVKSNLKSVYRKLGVTTRSDAVDAARKACVITS